MSDINSPDDTSPDLPKFLVHWDGELPEIGQNVVALFQLVCPTAYSVRPTCKVQVDAKLDHETPKPHPRQIATGKTGNWTFNVEFGLTTDGNDCRPGTYLIKLDVRFSGLSDRRLPSLFHCEFGVKVRRESGDRRRELVIECEGQSIVNLHGHSLADLDTVVLKGSDDGIINIQRGMETDTPVVEPPVPAKITLGFPLTAETLLTPFRSETFTDGSRTDAATLVFDNGHRTLLFAKRTNQWRWKLGRHRHGNEIITRFLPRSEKHDALSLKLSRTHAELELTSEGLLLRDHSRMGIWIEDFTRVEGDKLFTADKDSDGGIAVGLGDVRSDQFRMELRLFAAPEDPVQLAESKIHDVMYSEILGQPTKQLKLAFLSRLEAVRLRRETTLEEEEDYVLLFSQATIGVSEERNPVVLDDLAANRTTRARFIYAARRFWLENLGERQEDVTVNGVEIPKLELVPLEFGMQLQLGCSKLVFESKSQLGLGDLAGSG